MKKLLRLVLSSLLCALTALGGLALAEEIPQVAVDIAFEGSYAEWPEHNLKILLPSDWRMLENTEGFFAAGNDDDSQVIELEVFASVDTTMEALYTEFSGDLDFADVQLIAFNGIPFVIYTVPSENLFGALTISAQQDFMYFFRFYPADDEAFGNLAIQIMSTLDVLAG